MPLYASQQTSRSLSVSLSLSVKSHIHCYEQLEQRRPRFTAKITLMFVPPTVHEYCRPHIVSSVPLPEGFVLLEERDYVRAGMIEVGFQQF